MVLAGKIPYESPLCATIQLQHRELIATSLTSIALFTEASSPEPATIALEDITYDTFDTF